MGTHRALRSRSWPGRASYRTRPARQLPSRKLIALVTGVVLAVAAVVVYAASAAARHGHQASGAGGRGGPGTAASGQRGQAGTGAGGPMAAVPPSIGLRPGAVSPSAAGIARAMAALPKLTVEQLAGQRVIYSYRGLTPPAGLLSLIRKGDVAGVIFFSDNVGSNAHIAAVVRELQRADAARTNPVRLPLLLMTDQEGGLVRRLDGPPKLSAKQIGASAHPWQTATAEGAAAGSFMHGLGVNVNLAPVLDVYRTAGNFIDEFGRSFSSNAATVQKLGQLFATAMQRKGVAATVKHFPGLGAAARSQNTDERPVTLRVPLAQLRSVDERPYTAAVAARVKLAMVSWAVYPALDGKFPAGLSARIVRGELRNRLGFAGVTITDALGAGALEHFGATANRARLAARAGMDLILCASERYAEGVAARSALRSAFLAVGPAARAAFKAAAERVLALRATLGP